MGELTEDQLHQIQHIKLLKQKRIDANAQIQAEFDKLNSLQEKFLFLYNLLKNNQLEFAKWNKTDFLFNHKFSRHFIKKSRMFSSNKDLVDLFKDEIIKPLGQGHCYFFERNLSENFLSERIMQDKEDDNNFKYEFLDENTLYISIKSFSKAFFNFDKNKANLLRKKIENMNIKNFILDIRGNRGGTDLYLNLILFMLQSSMTYTLEWHNTLLHENESYTISHNFGDKSYNNFILIDNKVFSAAEVITKAFKQNGATIIGAKTGGEAGISPELQIKVFSYKNSKNKDVNFILQIPISAPLDKKGKIDYEFTYTKPDIECNPEDALKIALATIKTQHEQTKTL